jgi:alkylhydroperoxidase family enzyme
MPRIDLPVSDDYDLASLAFSTYAPVIGTAAMMYSTSVYQHTKLSLRELEGARYRTALINGCQVCQNFRGGRDLDAYLQRSGGDPVDRGPAPEEPYYSAVRDWAVSPLFSERERIAIELAERMGERPHSMHGDEEFWSRVHAHFSDREIVDLTLSIGAWIALGRVVHTLQLDAVCMPSFAAQAA